MRYIYYRLLLMLLIVFLFNRSTAPAEFVKGIQTSSGHRAETLVKDVFARGACDNITNIRPIGHPDGIGLFENGTSSIGMERGIMIATGSVKQAEGPNQAGDKSGNFDDSNGDPDLAKLSTHRILDAVGIEFDFTPLDSFVSFRYVFASEEYCEFVGSVYNDVFGFFISGPGIQGNFSRNSKNVALIPGSNAYVSINSVNHTQNSNYFIRNELEQDARQCGIAPANSPYQELIEYDGFTKILTANLQVIPCETYHIRFVVSDVADRHYDSAVFLEAGSFNIGGTVNVKAVGNNQTTAMEGCEPSAFLFERGETENLDKPLSVRIKISESSTAQEGVDFERFPRSITIPAGQKSARLPVRFFNDGAAENTEKLAIELDIPCACYSGAAALDVIDAPPLSLALPTAYVCSNASSTLRPMVRGGVPPYTYRWSTGATSPEIEITSGNTNRYGVTVTDACGNILSSETAVQPIAPPSAMLAGGTAICAGDTAHLSLSLTGKPPFRIAYKINGASQPIIKIDSVGNGPFFSATLPATQAGKYELIQVEDAGCSAAAAGSAQVEVISIELESQIQPVRCADGNDGIILVRPADPSNTYRYRWGHTNAANAQLQQLFAGIYPLTVTDEKGCEDTFAMVVPEPLPLQPVSFQCADLTDPNFQLSAAGGTPPYRYSLDGTNFNDADIFQTLEPGKIYNLLVQDAEGCELRQSLIVPPVYEKMVELPTQIALHLGEQYEFTPQLNIAETLIAKIEWISGSGLSCTDCRNPTVEVVGKDRYTVKITDIFGCTGEASLQLEIDADVDIYIPTAFSPNGDHHNDFFTVYADEKQVTEVHSLLVFDRWGNQVFAAAHFQPNDERVGWDGLVNGKMPNSAVFVYVAHLQLRDGNIVIRKGQLILLP